MIELAARDHDGLHEWIVADRCPVLLDGGLSTQLGVTDISGPLWTARALLEAPDRVRQAHHEFLQAGAELLITGSYQVSRQGFVGAGYRASDADEALRRSVVVARQAVAEFDASASKAGTQRRTPLVAASVGPYGAILHDGSEYVGNYGISEGQLREFHRERLDVLAETDADLIAVETIPDLCEVEVIVDLLTEYPHLVATISCTLRDAGHLSAGQRLEALADLGTDQVLALGVNCCSVELIPAAIGHLRTCTDKPVIAYPNGGGLWDASTEQWIPSADGVPGQPLWTVMLPDAPVPDLVGGCCGTGAGDIALLRRELEKVHHHVSDGDALMRGCARGPSPRAAQ